MTIVEPGPNFFASFIAPIILIPVDPPIISPSSSNKSKTILNASASLASKLISIGAFLKRRNKKICIGLVDPMGSALHNYYSTGTLKSKGSSITEGIGQSRITENLKKAYWKYSVS